MATEQQAALFEGFAQGGQAVRAIASVISWFAPTMTSPVFGSATGEAAQRPVSRSSSDAKIGRAHV